MNRSRPLAAQTSFALGLALLAACGGKPAAPLGPPDGSYAVRGEIVQLPRPGSDEILLHHESVPDLKDADGKVIGMESMTMPFPLGADVDRSQLTAGERISFTLEVRWKGDRPALVTHVAPLPAGTRLEFDPPDESAPKNP